MLVTFLKEAAEGPAISTIPKFVDRIFLPSSIFWRPKSQMITVLRLFCVEVDATSPAALHHLLMVMPSLQRVTVLDVSERMLQHNNPWMRTAKEFAILDLDRRLIRWDGLPGSVRVARHLTVESTQIGRFSGFRILLNEPVNPGERLGIALMISFAGGVMRDRFLERRVDFTYFCGNRPAPADLPAARGVPCLAWHSGNPHEPFVNGGFDVFLIHSRRHRFSPIPPEPTLSALILDYDRDGQPVSRPREILHGWKPRRLFQQLLTNSQINPFGLQLDVRGVLAIPLPPWLLPAIVVTVSFLLAVFVAPLLVRRIWGP